MSNTKFYLAQIQYIWCKYSAFGAVGTVSTFGANAAQNSTFSAYSTKLGQRDIDKETTQEIETFMCMKNVFTILD